MAVPVGVAPDNNLNLPAPPAPVVEVGVGDEVAGNVADEVGEDDAEYKEDPPAQEEWFAFKDTLFGFVAEDIAGWTCKTHQQDKDGWPTVPKKQGQTLTRGVKVTAASGLEVVCYRAAKGDTMASLYALSGLAVPRAACAEFAKESNWSLFQAGIQWELTPGTPVAFPSMVRTTPVAAAGKRAADPFVVAQLNPALDLGAPPPVLSSRTRTSKRGAPSSSSSSSSSSKKKKKK